MMDTDFIPLENYRLIGDLQSAALVSNEGSIEWLCLPNFDSPAVFNRLLDRSGGLFGIANSDNFKTSAQYEDNTAVVETTFKNEKDRFIVNDFMVPTTLTPEGAKILERTITAQNDRCDVTLFFDPRPEYGKISPEISIHEKAQKTVLTGDMNGGNVALQLPSDTCVNKHESGYLITVSVHPNQPESVRLVYAKDNSAMIINGTNWKEKTKRFWHDWIQKTRQIDFCKETIKRSAITLKLLQHHDTGAFVAAPTTSLPETIGGSRNWDYRFAWIRDATYTLYSLLVLGLHEETVQFFRYITDILTTREKEVDAETLRHFYTIHGDEVQAEYTLDHLDGYRDSQPVRVGNSASEQFQLDSYGVMIDAFYLAHREGVELNGRHESVIRGLLKSISSMWQKKDNGIWEVRESRQHYTYSKVMCWVGIDRALRMKDALFLSDEYTNKLKQLQEDIHNWIWEHCYDEEKNIITQHPNTTAQDATTFLFPLIQFLDKDRHKTQTIIKNAREELCFDDTFVYRYRTEDGLSGSEGAFTLCTFWMISALAKIGKAEEAKKLFDKFEGRFAESGLLSEEIDPSSESYLGNFPQAFSHMGYIMSAYYLQKYLPDNK